MSEKPIGFSTPAARAIIEGRKTNMWDEMVPQPRMDSDNMWHWKDCQWMDGGLGFPDSGIDDYAKYKVGDILRVRGTWADADLPMLLRVKEVQVKQVYADDARPWSWVIIFERTEEE
jgi:hypothetical protein